MKPNMGLIITGAIVLVALGIFAATLRLKGQGA
jgi:hypothetical protein